MERIYVVKLIWLTTKNLQFDSCAQPKSSVHFWMLEMTAYICSLIQKNRLYKQYNKITLAVKIITSTKKYNI